MRVVVVGARRARQGIGAFVAEALVGCGCEVVGVVGTTPETVHSAAQPLNANGYLDLAEALASEKPDLVAICSPIEAHAEQLRIVADAGCHCLCEKPLLWPPAATTSRVLDNFEKNGKHLALLTQWPHTLPAFYALHPDAATGKIESFIMRLSPISTGPRMLLDSMSHPLSMLERLCGHARVQDVVVQFEGEACRVEFNYRGVACMVGLQHRAEPPRPASYAINGCVVSRVIGEDYEIYLEVPYGKRLPLRDPMPLRVREVLRAAQAGVPTDRESITLGMQNLEALLVGLQP